MRFLERIQADRDIADGQVRQSISKCEKDKDLKEILSEDITEATTRETDYIRQRYKY